MSSWPALCDECGNDCRTVFDHDRDCSTGQRIAERSLKHHRDLRGTAWELASTGDRIAALREFLSDAPKEAADGEVDVVDLRRAVTCSECDSFALSRRYRGATGTVGHREYLKMEYPETCPVCGGRVVDDD